MSGASVTESSNGRGGGLRSVSKPVRGICWARGGGGGSGGSEMCVDEGACACAVGNAADDKDAACFFSFLRVEVLLPEVDPNDGGGEPTSHEYDGRGGE